MKIRYFLSAAFIFLIISCSLQDLHSGTFNLSGKTFNGKDISISDSSSIYVLLFMNPDCPLCRSYSSLLSAYKNEYGPKIKWISVFPGKWIIEDSVQSFLRDYKLNTDEVLFDKGKIITKEYKVSVTPTAVVVGTSGEVLYQGRIDDWAYEIGKTKLAADSHDLKRALDEIIHSGSVSVPKTDPVGCLIE